VTGRDHLGTSDRNDRKDIMLNRRLTIGTFALLGALAPFTASAQSDEAQFTIRVENVSTAKTLRLSNGSTAPAPTAPVLWALTDGANPLFSDGEPDRGQGLEQLAEDGNPERLATQLAAELGASRAGAVAIPVGQKKAGPITPGLAYQFTVTATRGQHITLAMMFGQSNDLFYAPGAKAIALFDRRGRPRTADITSELVLWDAGTEVNEEPGLGPNQAPRQGAPDTGPAENGAVRRARDRYTYPAVRRVLKVTIAPATGPKSSQATRTRSLEPCATTPALRALR
jgi:hypothetical protein